MKLSKAFDEYGRMILTTYDNDYKAMMMDIRVYSMKAVDIPEHSKAGGKITYMKAGWQQRLIPEGPYRKSVATEEESEILVQCTHTMTRHLQADYIRRTMHLGATQVSKKFGNVA